MTNCSVDQIIHENVEELIYVKDFKYVIVILFILVGLKFRKQCRDSRDKVNSSDSIRSVWPNLLEMGFIYIWRDKTNNYFPNISENWATVRP